MTQFRTQFDALIARREVIAKHFAPSNWVVFDQTKWDATPAIEVEIAGINARLDDLMRNEEARQMKAAGVCRPMRRAA